jgi:hypothetical protein
MATRVTGGGKARKEGMQKGRDSGEQDSVQQYVWACAYEPDPIITTNFR